MINKKTLKKFLEIQQSDKKQKKAFVENVIFFMVFMLTLLVVVIASTVFTFQNFITIDLFAPILADLLMIFIIAELMIIILLLHRISKK